MRHRSPHELPRSVFHCNLLYYITGVHSCQPSFFVRIGLITQATKALPRSRRSLRPSQTQATKGMRSVPLSSIDSSLPKASAVPLAPCRHARRLRADDCGAIQNMPSQRAILRGALPRSFAFEFLGAYPSLPSKIFSFLKFVTLSISVFCRFNRGVFRLPCGKNCDAFQNSSNFGS